MAVLPDRINESLDCALLCMVAQSTLGRVGRETGPRVLARVSGWSGYVCVCQGGHMISGVPPIGRWSVLTDRQVGDTGRHNYYFILLLVFSPETEPLAVLKQPLSLGRCRRWRGINQARVEAQTCHGKGWLTLSCNVCFAVCSPVCAARGWG